MRIMHQRCIRRLIHALIISLTLISFWGCANVQHQASFNKNYLPKENVRIKVAKVVNDTGFTFDIDIEQMLTNALEQQLMEENLLNLGKTEPNLFLESRIIGYKKGSAFKRWMMPGWGATELAIQCDLKDGNNNLVGSAMSNREVFAGGLYTVGAWETIFKETANDVAEDLKDQIEAQGYVVEAKTKLQGITAANDIEQSASASAQPQEAPKLASVPKDSPVIRVSLRRQPKAIENQLEIRRILAKYNFFEISMNTHGSFANDLVDNNDDTLTDNATGLMWQKGGSLELLDNRSAKNYIKQLNSQRFAGYSDWRMPTIEELMSLLNRYKNNGVYIAPQFSNQQTTCWSIDQTDYDSGAWIVNFCQGEVREARWRSSYSGGSLAPGSLGSVHKNTINHIKAVRSLEPQ